MTDKLRKLQLIELSLFKQFDSICRKYHVRYYALGGTLLGAVRHQGFIPWDDDMDIGVPREEYERLKKILPNELKEGAEYHSFENDPSYYRYFSRIEDNRIKVKRTDNIIPEFSSA